MKDQQQTLQLYLTSSDRQDYQTIYDHLEQLRDDTELPILGEITDTLILRYALRQTARRIEHLKESKP